VNDESCPVPIDDDVVVLAHGGGGRKMRRLLDEIIVPAFASRELLERHDAAVLATEGAHVAFTTDSYGITPLEFPGGYIGRLAICGTVNDLACAGARPSWISVAFVLEEGLPIATLRRIVASMQRTAAEVGAAIVTGDTKVVERGKGDGMFITTSGVGRIRPGAALRPSRVRERDAVIVTGDIGRHGIAILSVRQGLRFDTAIESDCAPLASLVFALLDAGIDLHCARDLTRGGLCAALDEIATSAELGISIDEIAIPVHETIAGACELLGMDPIHVACEGRMALFLPEGEVERAMAVLPEGAARVGTVTRSNPGAVTLRTAFGPERVLDLPLGEQLPRIC